ncbi:MAG: lysophospholipid acyltransferase family protein [Pseudomonadota bacterium]
MILLAKAVGQILAGTVWILVGAAGHWRGCAPIRRQRIYFANHTSHIDTVALWSALPVELRQATRPIAAKDYWGKTFLRRYLALKVLQAVLIDRQRTVQDADPLAPALAALQEGHSLIIFPEGTRCAQRLPGEFKSGLFRLAEKFPDVELVPVYLENLYRSMPKGSFLPVPVTCSVWFGRPIQLQPDEPKEKFLQRAREAIVELA